MAPVVFLRGGRDPRPPGEGPSAYRTGAPPAQRASWGSGPHWERIDRVSEARDEPLRVYFDGLCPLCRGTVRAALRLEDVPGSLRFAPLDGPTFRERFGEEARAALPDSLVVEVPTGELRLRSDAVVAVLARLGRPGRVAAALLRAVPRRVRDAGYRLIARVRRPFRYDPARCPRLPERWVARIDP